ncbi:MAG: hypothetical protein ACFE0R_07190 [Salinarimonas sp.]
MDALYLSTDSGENTSLCITPLTRELVSASGEDPADAGGYFLYERQRDNPSRIEILARVASEEAAIKLARLLHLK